VSLGWTNGGGPALNATNLNKLAVVDDVATAGTPTGDALRAAYAATAGTANAPEVQLGPTTRTIHSGAVGNMHGVVGLQNNDPAGDGTTRLYILPNSATPPNGYTYGETAGIKVMGDPYFDGAAYRDLGIVFAPEWIESAPHDGGSNGTGAFWINSKVGPDAATAPAYWGKNPDIGFSFQDGTFIAGRFSYVVAANGQSAWTSLIVGAGKPDIAKKTSAIKLEVQGDIGFNGSGRSLRWYESDGATADNTITLNPSNVTFMFASTQRLVVRSNGNLVMGTGAGQQPTNAQTGFLHLTSMAGAPTAAPAAETGAVPIVLDTTNNKLWAYLNGAWKGVGLS
jgi:hypothetical protein